MCYLKKKIKARGLSCRFCCGLCAYLTCTCHASYFASVLCLQSPQLGMYTWAFHALCMQHKTASRLAPHIALQESSVPRSWRFACSQCSVGVCTRAFDVLYGQLIKMWLVITPAHAVEQCKLTSVLCLQTVHTCLSSPRSNHTCLSYVM